MSAIITDFPATTRARSKVRRSALRRLQADAYKAGFIHIGDQARAGQARADAPNPETEP